MHQVVRGLEDRAVAASVWADLLQALLGMPFATTATAALAARTVAAELFVTWTEVALRLWLVEAPKDAEGAKSLDVRAVLSLPLACAVEVVTPEACT